MALTCLPAPGLILPEKKEKNKIKPFSLSAVLAVKEPDKY
jgi:hypothetical protein